MKEEPFIGREAEISVLKEALSRTEEGAPKMMLISGELGIGKTRLVNEARPHIEEEGFTYLHGKCYDKNSDPYLPLREAFDRYEHKEEELTPEVTGFFSAYPSSEHEDTRILRGEKKTMFHETLRRIRVLLDEQPLFVFLDDLQFGDKSTLNLIYYLSVNLRNEPILFTGAYDEEELQTNPPLRRIIQRMNEEGVLKEIELKSMTFGEIQTLLEKLIPSTGSSTKLIRFLHSRTGGNPLFIKEFVRYIVDEREIDLESFSTKDIRDISMPGAVTGILNKQIEDLHKRTRNVLQIGSVIGRKIEYPLILQVTDIDEFELLDELDTLTEKKLLREDSEDSFWFTHPLLMKVVYDSIPKLKKRKLHERTAEAMKEFKNKKVYINYLELADHYEKAGDLSLAFQYYYKAGKECEKIRAWRIAVDSYDKALQVIEGQDGEERYEEKKDIENRTKFLKDEIKEQEGKRVA
ncbi:MAG: AAA family ATPase [Candidatus Thermoplasmatota archaeon]|nr:AAA family ATPase [Candidatus Thermoplasmatota archaeon]